MNTPDPQQRLQAQSTSGARPARATSRLAHVLRAASIVMIAVGVCGLFVGAFAQRMMLLATSLSLLLLGGCAWWMAQAVTRLVQRLVTQYHEAEQARARAEEQFHALADRALVGAYIIQQDRFVFVNPRLSEIVGYTEQELLAAAEALEILAMSAPAIVEAVWHCVKGQTPQFHVTCQTRRKDGALIEVEMLGTRVMINGQPAILGTLVDLTEQKRLAQALEQQASELRQRNTELTQRERVMQSLLEDLQSNKERVEAQAYALQTANKRLEEMGALKDEFIAKVSHELRTPLTSIKEGLSLLLDEVLGTTSEQQRDFLSTMNGDVDRLAEFINNMLDVSKIESGRMRFQRRRLSVAPLIEATITSCQAIMGHRRVRTEQQASVPSVFADPDRLRQVLTNFLSNALKSTPDDGSIIFRVTQHSGLVGVAVEDNGKGIAPEDLSKLFQKFSQVGQPSMGASRGTGLGLVICKELVELHRGRIEVASEVGKGTSFTMWLPAYTDAFALQESFQELKELAPLEQSEHVGFAALQVGLRTAPQDGPTVRRDALERAADEVRRLVHRGDVVLALDPSWVVVLAVADAAGMQAMIDRLRGIWHGEELIGVGLAMYPEDGQEAARLFQHAAARLQSGWPVTSEAAKPS